MEWRNKCEYQCLECGKMTLEMTQAIKHVQSKHGMECKEYKVKHGIATMMTKEVKYQCTVCERFVQWCKHGLEQHAKTHKMSLFDLYMDYFNKNSGDGEHTPVQPTQDSANASVADETDPLGKEVTSES